MEEIKDEMKSLAEMSDPNSLIDAVKGVDYDDYWMTKELEEKHSAWIYRISPMLQSICGHKNKIPEGNQGT